jgi:hypothetical protein
MTENAASIPIPNVKESNNKLLEYFVQLVPDYDRDRVYASDVKKVIKWYAAMKESGFLEQEEEPSDPPAEKE